MAINLIVDPSTVSRVVSRFNTTGNVDVQLRKGAPVKLSAFDEFVIMENILKRPEMYEDERWRKETEQEDRRRREDREHEMCMMAMLGQMFQGVGIYHNYTGPHVFYETDDFNSDTKHRTTPYH